MSASPHRQEAWHGLRQGLQRVVAFRGARAVAAEIPASPVTVYRLLKSDTPPSLAVEEGVKRVVQQGVSLHDEQSAKRS